MREGEGRGAEERGGVGGGEWQRGSAPPSCRINLQIFSDDAKTASADGIQLHLAAADASLEGEQPHAAGREPTPPIAPPYLSRPLPHLPPTPQHHLFCAYPVCLKSSGHRLVELRHLLLRSLLTRGVRDHRTKVEGRMKGWMDRSLWGPSEGGMNER